MRIADVKAVYPNYRHVAPSWRTHLWQIVVRVESDTGGVGFGYGGGGKAAVEVVNGHMRELLVGRRLDDRDDIFGAWDALYYESIPYGRKGIGVMALSGVDPRAVGSAGEVGGRARPCRHRAEDEGDDSRIRDGRGARSGTARWGSRRTSSLTAGQETSPTSRRLSRRRRAPARSWGRTPRLMIDTYMTWDSETTVEMGRRLAPYDIFWFEDVLTPDDLEGQAALRGRVGRTLIAGGEHEFTHIGFDAVAKWVRWTCGSRTSPGAAASARGLRILDIAREHEIPVAPHRGGEVWGLHLIAASDCMDLAEVLPGMRGGAKDEL